MYAAAANAESVRCALSVAAKKRWLAAISDINQAFTLTPISEADTRYAVLAPKVLVEAGCVPPGTAYLVERLLYGLREAPRLWGGFRDKRFRNAKIKIGGEVFRLIQLETDAAVWKLVKDDSKKTTEEFAAEEAQALIIVYVDDVMFLGDEEVILSLYSWVTEGGEGETGGWKCSALEFVNQNPVRYLGMELRSKIEGKFSFFHISQGGYIEDLLREYQEEDTPPSKVPATRELMPQEFLDENKEDHKGAPSEELTRLAQKAAGELLWLSTRTRPDLSFATSHVCSAATKDPEAALRLSAMARRYLATSKTLGLTYVGVDEPVTVYTDASYAPQATKSHGCIATTLFGSFVTWRSAKQPVISLSVAEAELYEVVAGFQQGLSIKAWIEEVIPNTNVRMRVDNTAALGLASTSPGSWRTRHLRVRARFLRQEAAEGRLDLAHTPGERQAADLGTKAVSAQRLQQLLQLWRMGSAEEFLGSVCQGPLDAEVAIKLMTVILVCSSLTCAEAKNPNDKPPMQVDGSLEFYGSILVCGLAMLGVWEFLRWIVNKMCCSRDEASILRARRLLRIRDQTARALRQELATLTPEASLDIQGEEGEHQAPSSGTSVRSVGHPEHVPARGSAEPDPAMLGPSDITEAEARRRNYTFRCLPPPFFMSEHGERVHVRQDCFGLRNANKAKLKRVPYCTCCAEKYPLYYRTPDGDPLLG